MNEKEIIQKLASKLNWERKEVRLALKEFKDSTNILSNYECNQFLSICLNIIDPDDRVDTVQEYLLTLLLKKFVPHKRNKTREFDIKGCTDFICQIIEIDSFARVLSFFNIVEYMASKDIHNQRDKTYIEFLRCIPIYNSNEIDTFLGDDFIWHYTHNDLPPTFLINVNYEFKSAMTYLTYVKPKNINILENTNPLNISYNTADLILSSFMKSHFLTSYFFSDVFSGDIFCGILDKIGIKAFNCRYFNTLINQYLNLNTNHPVYQYIKTSFSPFPKGSYLTQRYYWKIFIIVDEISHSKSVTKACEITAKILNDDKNTIRTRYYEMKKKFNNTDKEIKEIKREFNLFKEINELQKYSDLLNE